MGRSRWPRVMAVVPTVSTPVPITIAIFTFAQAISFKVPLLRARVELLAVAPFAVAAAATEAVKLAEAACNELAEIAPINMPADTLTPRRAKKAWSFPTARLMRFWTAVSF